MPPGQALAQGGLPKTTVRFSVLFLSACGLQPQADDLILGEAEVTRILIEEHAYARLESQLRAICTDLQFILMKADGLLYFQGEPITTAAAQPDVAWLNVDLARANLTQQYVQTVLATGTVKWLQTFNAGLD